ncbi:Tyrosinase-like protein 5 [Elsinoe fawcettii]|nr:Tyrosinase-like protein 5 [Elsinoe fawcettii]
MSRPSINDSVQVPGAKTRYDDFVVPHANQTVENHFTANFLPWRRYLIWSFEQALREECDYDGYLPYWNWPKYAHDPINSPVFDGSPGSIGSNGVFAPTNCTPIVSVESGFCIGPGEGGGCVREGPYSNITVNLGPISHITTDYPPDLFKYNPRCLKRDILPEISRGFTTEENVTQTLLLPTFEGFQFQLTGDVQNGVWGVHTAGHWTVVGDPGSDNYVAPADPTFYLTHTQVDRVWWIYQNLAPRERTLAVAGTITSANIPPSRNGTIDDIVRLGRVGGPITQRKLASTLGRTGGPLCYIYV